MNFFFENPLRILFIGIAIEAVLTLLLFQTGRGKWIGAIVAVAVLTAAGLIVERMVVTDRESVDKTLDEAVAAVKANDRNRMLDCIAPSAQGQRTTACWILDRFAIEEAHLSGVEITINRLTSPPTAEATFQAMGLLKDRKGLVPYNGFNQHVVVRLQPEGKRWLVVDYTIEGLQSVMK